MLRYHIVVAHLTLMALLQAKILPVTDSYSVNLHYLRLVKEWLETLDMERRFRADPAVLDHQMLEKIYHFILRTAPTTEGCLVCSSLVVSPRSGETTNR